MNDFSYNILSIAIWKYSETKANASISLTQSFSTFLAIDLISFLSISKFMLVKVIDSSISSYSFYICLPLVLVFFYFAAFMSKFVTLRSAFIFWISEFSSLISDLVFIVNGAINCQLCKHYLCLKWMVLASFSSFKPI